jgi:hypothetical protein
MIRAKTPISQSETAIILGFCAGRRAHSYVAPLFSLHLVDATVKINTASKVSLFFRDGWVNLDLPNQGDWAG